MTIAFSAIPSNTRVPGNYVEFDNRRAVRGLLNQDLRLLVLGQKLSAAPASANTLLAISSTEQAIEQFGRGSNLAHLVETIRAENPYVELWAMPLADNDSGTAATGTIAVAASSAAAGTLNLYIGGQRVQVAVAAGDSASTIATAINAAINADADLPVTSTVSTSTVTVAARHKGEVGNEIKIVENWAGAPSEVTPSGVTLTITQLSSGATNPVLTTALANLPDTVFNILVSPYTDTTSLNAIKDEIATRWGPTVKLQGYGFNAHRGTYANLVTFGGNRNNAYETVQGLKSTAHVPAYRFAAAYAAAYASVVQNKDVATPVRSTALKSIRLKKADEFGWTERNILLGNGLSTYTVGNDGTVYLEKAISTYKTNSAGSPDPSYGEVRTLFTLAYLRADWESYLDRTYPDFKLADDSNPPNAPRVVRPKDLVADVISRFILWQEAGLVEDLTQFKNDVRAERDLSNPNRVNMLLPPNLINGLDVIASVVQFIL